jgi:heptosyltransferase-1
MHRILIVKVTSLGDIVHGQPVVADLHCAFPGIKVDWAVDSAFADIARWNPGIDRVLSAPLRGFKKNRSGAELGAIFTSISELRREKYDVVLDLQGVYKSAIISFLARSRRRLGYRAADLGEGGAAFAYTERFLPREDLNAWDGLRRTVADAFGYKVSGAPSFGLTIPKPVGSSVALPDEPFAMLVHATSSDVKKWPTMHWVEIGRALVKRGITPLLPWGSANEEQEAIAIAKEVQGARVLPRMPILQVAQYVDAAALIVGTDTGFVHLASALGRKTVMIFTATARRYFGVEVPGVSTSVGDDGHAPSVTEVIDAIASLRLPF